MIVLKHDEVNNARSFELDREAWVMLLGFPEDLRCDAIIVKSVSGFGIMVHWHESLSLARVIVKVYLNDGKKVPSSIKVNAGLPTKGRSWSILVFVLKKKNVVELRHEDAFVTIGPLHPMPPILPIGLDQPHLLHLMLLQVLPTWMMLTCRLMALGLGKLVLQGMAMLMLMTC